MNRLLLTLLVGATLLLAGCTGGEEDNGDDTPPTTTPDNDPPTSSTPSPTPVDPTPDTNETPDGNETPPVYEPYTLEISGFPQAVEAGANFTFVLTATGGENATSDHLGAHFGNTSAPTAAPSTSVYARACPHITNVTDVPGTYHVTCSMPTAGTWYLRGHVRVGDNNSWGDEMTLVAREAWTPSGNYTLNLTGVPTMARANENVTLTLSMEGPTGVSDHFGAHFGRNSTDAPSTNEYPFVCTHQATPTTVPTTHTMTCSFPTPGVYHLRGHLRISEGLIPQTNNYWTGEYAILVE